MVFHDFFLVMFNNVDQHKQQEEYDEYITVNMKKAALLWKLEKEYFSMIGNTPGLGSINKEVRQTGRLNEDEVMYWLVKHRAEMTDAEIETVLMEQKR